MYYNPYDVANSPNNYNYTSRKCSRAVAMAVLLFHTTLFLSPQLRAKNV